MKYNYQTMSYEPDHLFRLLESDKVSNETKAWVRRELRLNGYEDRLEADWGEDPKQRV